MSKIPNDPDLLVEKLTPILAHIYRALEISVALRVQDFANRGRQVEPFDLSSGVRHEVKCRLLELADSDLRCEIMDLPNNGLQVVSGGVPIRIRKGDDGELPRASSDGIKGYYQQMSFVSLFPDAGFVESDVNLALVWGYDSLTRSLGLVVVGKPTEAGWEWRREVPHPATLQNGLAPDSPDFDLPDDDESDEGEATDRERL